jgi:hypothetical protein
MTSELTPIDIRQVPELAHLVDEVQATRKPRRIVRDGEDLAVLMPTPRRSRRPGAAPPPRTTRGIAARTAGALKQYAKHPPATREEEKEAFAQALAEEGARSSGA